jgi:hypothetical protein
MLDTIRFYVLLSAESCLPAAVGEAPRAIDYAIVGGVIVAIAVAAVAFVAAFLRRDDARARAMMQMPLED